MLEYISKYLRLMAVWPVKATSVSAVAAGLASLLLSSCFEGLSDNSIKEPLKVSRDNIRVGRGATVDYIGITASNASWTLSGDQDWCRVSQSSGEAGTPATVKVTFLENNGESATMRQATFIITAGGKTKEVSVSQLAVDIDIPNRNPEYDRNKSIFETVIKDWYYWDEEVGNTPADYNQSYRSFFDRYLLGLNQNEIDGNVWEAETEPYLYSYITRTPIAEVGLVPLNYGMEFELRSKKVENVSASVVARVLYVLDGSPAKVAGLKRGDWFYKINDVVMADYEEGKTGEMQYKRLIDTLVRPVEGESPKLGMLTFQEYSGKLFPANRDVTVSSGRFHGNPVIFSQVFPVPLRDESQARVGYLVYNSFDPMYRSEIVEEFGRFKSEEITHLVLDLRYNKTGTVEMAELMANLIVPSSMNGQVFAEYRFNGRHKDLDKTVYLAADAASVGLTTVYILTSRYTTGAAELLINSFRGLDDMTLVVTGDTTEGMNTGMVVRTYDTEEYQYKARLVAFRCYNADGDGDYQGGFGPNGGRINEFADDNIRWRTNGEWGWKEGTNPQQDPLLRRVRDYIIGNITMPTDEVIYEQVRRRSGYQRIFSVAAEMTMEVPE